MISEGVGFEKVIIPAEMLEGAEVVLGGNFKEVEVNSDDVMINDASGTTVDNVTDNGKGLTISGKGTVKKVVVIKRQ